MGGSELFEHGADVGVRGFGATAAEAFQGAARALFTLLAQDLGSVRPLSQDGIVCEAPDFEALLVAFLNELIFLADTKGLVFGRFAVDIERVSPGTFRLTGRAWGEPFDVARHESTVEPKGATFTELRVAQEGGRWVAQCIVDV